VGKEHYTAVEVAESAVDGIHTLYKWTSLTDAPNDFCLINLNQPVYSVPIYEVATAADVQFGEEVTIVGYGRNISEKTQSGGTQRDGRVSIISPQPSFIQTLGYPFTGQNCAKGDSGGPLFAGLKPGKGFKIAGVCHGANAEGVTQNRCNYSSTLWRENVQLIQQHTTGISPGYCPVFLCCYSASGVLCGSPYGSHLDQDQMLKQKGEQLTSDSGDAFLKLQEDGNLVLYDQSGGVALWSSGTASEDALGLNYNVEMQNDGNFVIYAHQTSPRTPVWASNTQNSGATQVKLITKGYPGGTFVQVLLINDPSVLGKSGPLWTVCQLYSSLDGSCGSADLACCEPYNVTTSCACSKGNTRLLNCCHGNATVTEKHKHTVAIRAGVGAGAVLCLLLSVALMVYRRRKQVDDDADGSLSNPLNELEGQEMLPPNPLALADPKATA
jgi:hypothetical protein